MAVPVFDPTKPYQVVPAAGAPATATPQFNPNAPYEAQTAPGKLESFLRGIKQSATLGFGDELTALAESAFTPKTYDQSVGEARANDAAAQKENPWSYGGGQLAGGLATAAIPGLGAGGIAGATTTAGKLGQAALLGGKIGGISALGEHQGGDVLDNVEAGLKGAAGGAVSGAVLQGAGSLIGHAGQVLAKKLTDAVKPQAQLALAIGAGKNELNPANEALYRKVANSVTKMQEEGLFREAESGPLDEHELFRRVQTTLADKGAAIGERVKTYGNKFASNTMLRRLYDEATQEMVKVLETAPPGARAAAETELSQALNELRDTGGNLADLWDLKSKSGGWASKAWTMAGQPPPVKEGFMKLNRVLDEFLSGETGVFAEKAGDQALRGLNASYSAAATIEPLLGNLIGKLEAAPGSLGFGARDLGAGGMTAGIAAGLGAGPLAAPIGFAGAALNQWGRSVPGRVMRAQIGQALENKAAQASVAMGAIPRKTAEAQAWLRQHMQMLPPQMQQTASAIVGAPPDRAEQMLRTVIPMFAQHFARSSYPSELDGKVSTDDDKAVIRKRLQALQLPSTTMALRLSILNKTGQIPIEAFDPASYGEDINDLVTKMMGPQSGGMQ